LKKGGVGQKGVFGHLGEVGLSKEKLDHVGEADGGDEGGDHHLHPAEAEALEPEDEQHVEDGKQDGDWERDAKK